MSSTIIQTESLREFYKRTNQEIPYDLLQERSGPGHFNVKLSHTIARKTPYNRRDYFKICLSNGGSGIFRYNGQEIKLDRPCLIFSNPSVAASIEIPTGSATRYYCLFNNRFIEGYISPDIQYACALFNPSLPPVIWLTSEERDKLHLYFVEQQLQMESNYPFKWDMIRNLLLLLIHEGIRLQQAGLSHPLPGSDRVVKNFFTLLNQQFPVHSPENPLIHLSPSQFAGLLHVHVNHLNSVVKKQTGKTTRAIIHERIIHEAKAMLQNTDWNIAEIAYALGFEYPSHFNKQFKQFALVTPMEFRTTIKTVIRGHL